MKPKNFPGRKLARRLRAIEFIRRANNPRRAAELETLLWLVAQSDPKTKRSASVAGERS